jgi:tetratricopeptide (TPR) repeat protein
MKDFFISYNKADRAWAEWIAWQLDEAGYTTIVQAWDFRPGSNFVLGMQHAAIESARTIGVLSSDYLNALFTQPEWAAAFAQDLPEGLAAATSDALRLDEALMALRKYSLADVENAAICIHRLVQAVLRHAMDDKALEQWTRAAVHVVNTSFPDESDDVRTWPICSSLLPHSSAALSHADAIQFSSSETLRLLNQVGMLLMARAEYQPARGMLERVVALSEASLGPNHPLMAVRLNNLGNVLRAQGDLAGARALFERALAISEAALNPNHPEVAIRLNNLGEVLRAQGKLGAAKSLLERALTIEEALRGINHPVVATALNNLGGVLRDQGDLAGATSLYERALAIFELSLGKNHPQSCVLPQQSWRSAQSARQSHQREGAPRARCLDR